MLLATCLLGCLSRFVYDTGSWLQTVHVPTYFFYLRAAWHLRLLPSSASARCAALHVYDAVALLYAVYCIVDCLAAVTQWLGRPILCVTG